MEIIALSSCAAALPTRVAYCPIKKPTVPGLRRVHLLSGHFHNRPNSPLQVNQKCAPHELGLRVAYLQIQEDGAGDVLASPCLREEGVEGIVLQVQASSGSVIWIL